MKISIVNARVIDPASGQDAPRAIHIQAGIIAALGDAPPGFVPNRSIDAQGLVAIPGLVDLAARLREPGFEHKATLESEIGAALAGGVTSLACPPDTDPVLDEPGLIEMLKHKARGLDAIRVFPLGALTVGLKGAALTEMAELTEAGCVGFAQPGALISDTQVLLRAMQYAHGFGYTVWLQPQDPKLGRDGVAHGGAVAGRLGLSGVPTIAETIALQTILELVRATGCRVHICRLSSAAGIEIVRRAKSEGLPVSCDVAVHHLHQIDVDIGFFDSNHRVHPPFRAQRDRDAIRAGVADGTIDAICSDHTPVDDDAKQLPFGEAEPGVTGLELLLPLTLKWAEEARVKWADALGRVTYRAADVLGVAGGRIAVGDNADLCLFDPREHWKVGRETLVSQSVHTPYFGRELVGRVRTVLVGGKVALER